jgi:hypothetical protein
MVKLYDLLGFDEVWFGEHHSGGCELIVDPLTFIAHRIFAPFDGVAVRTRPSQHAQGHVKWWRPPAPAAGQRPVSSQLNRGRSADVHPKLGHDERAAGARASAHPRCHELGFESRVLGTGVARTHALEALITRLKQRCEAPDARLEA